MSVAPRQFEIWWIVLGEPVGRRPVLVVGRTVSFTYLHRVLAAEITTTIRGIPQEVALGKREGLAKPCVVNLDALRGVSRNCFVARAGYLASRRHVEVKRALGHVLLWPELTGLP